MFFAASQIIEAIKKINSVHPFLGITFLTCKKELLTVGKSMNFPMDQSTKVFMEKIHRLNPRSRYFYQPYKINKAKYKEWVSPNYPSTGLQSVNTRGPFKDAFFHENTRSWGWKPNYIDIIQSKLINNKKIPSFYLAIWLFRQKEWAENTSPKDILEYFFKDYNITDNEREQLFDEALPNSKLQFQEYPVEWSELSSFIQSPPDVGPDQGGTLSFLELKNLGPAKHISFIPSRRLNIITGDNGLGKSFLLECAWWALTATWAEMQAYPNIFLKESEASITFELAGKIAHPERKEIKYDIKTHSWPTPSNRPTMPGLIVYARVDGSFAVWDPARFQSQNEDNVRKATLVLSRTDVWNGSRDIEGLIRDWVSWQRLPDKNLFEVFSRVLKRLSPPDLGELVPGQPVRIPVPEPNNRKEIPTIKHPYGEIPILYTAAGVRRIITIAYLIVWAWNEHLITSNYSGRKPESRMVVMIDEIEAHLHPKWQRVILPAMMDIQNILSNDLEIQFFVATHSPLVLASSETFFDTLNDKLFHLEFIKNNEVNLVEEDFIKYGQVNSWLTSPIFEMRHARSKEAEIAIEEAKTLQMLKEVKTDDVKLVHEKLLSLLAENDQFWPRWIYFAEKNGVKL